GFATPVMRYFSPQAVLLMSAVVSTIGLYLLSTLTGNAIFFSAIIFGIGVCYFWPTMLGFVAENIPQSGALGMNLIAGAGMFAVTAYTLVMGKFYDNLVLDKLPDGADMSAYLQAPPGTEMADLLYQAKSAAGPEVLTITSVI